MRFLMLVYIDPQLLAELPTEDYNREMLGCLEHADELRATGAVLDSQQLEDVQTARTLRIREGRTTITDGPFAETRELLGGFNLIEADDLDAAMRIASEFPWARYGSIEVRPVRDMQMVRLKVSG